MDIITVKIKINNDNLTFEERADLIIDNLRSLADVLEIEGGNIQNMTGKDDDSTLEYVHLKQD